MHELRDLLARLANRDVKRAEATVQADIRLLLLTAPLDLGDHDLRDVVLEAQAGEGRRIDIETGSTVIEVKRDLRKGNTLQKAVAQLAGYVEAREAEMGRRFAGIVTDGAEWICHHVGPKGLAPVSSFEVHHERPEVEPLLVWLEGVLATTQSLQPRPSEIALRLGATSSSYALDRASLSTLYMGHKNVPSVKMKRQLWARLLTTAFGKQFEDKDDLFVEHTLLVVTAEIIAHAVVGLPLESIEPASLVSGEKFRESGIHGVVESDFFDWMIDVPGGEVFVRTLARRLARFDWTRVEHDVLKVLYESIITTETRKKLGEYYTPDWLAEQVVDAVVRKPLDTRVLDPACGSGTFLFHAVRRHLEAADAADLTAEAALAGLTSHVIGIDLHPVAVTLARVTYLLAIGHERLVAGRDDIQVPVFLGDSMQWRQERLELFTGGHLVWGYFVRNLARPLWSSRPDNRVDALVGNPPWLAYRHMPALMQEQFKELSQFRGLWSGAKVATHQDLSALFVARVVQLYLRPEGRFGFLMPNTVVDLAQYEGFRKGDYADQSEPVYVAFDRPWDLRKVRPHFFPRPCAAVFGRRVKRCPVAMTADAEGWFGKIPTGAVAWDEVKDHIERKKTLLRVAPDEPQSPYHGRFRQGATIVPRALFVVELPPPGPLGMPEGRVLVRSTRSASEKKPWKGLPRLEGVVETEHVRPVYVGSSILPYRTLPSEKAVLPLERKGLLPDARLAMYKGLGQWWSKAEAAWLAHRSSERLSLRERLDYHRELSNQFPLQPARIVYGKSGMHLCCAVVRDRRAIIDHTLYWATPSTEDEAAFLCGILNAVVTTERVRPLMSHGKDERHIDKHLWRLPIPLFDARVKLHAQIAMLATEVEARVAALELDSDTNPVALRRQIRAHLAEDDAAQKLERLVETLLSPPPSGVSKTRMRTGR